MKVTLVGANGSGADAMYSGPFGPKAWVNPISAGYHLSSPFGWRWGRLHAGQDMACPTGTAVRAISSGEVIFAGWQGGYGYKVEIRHWDGTVSYYGHNSKLKVTEGQVVATGQLIALSGNTGHSTGPHLHLEIHPNGGGPVPPMRWLAAHGVTL
ncbi:MAG: M23 family metallopeptidase [Actinomycetales bacterium]|nr:M23 family metallopeptidase [Candidatus Phosphoribacter baldrii]